MPPRKRKLDDAGDYSILSKSQSYRSNYNIDATTDVSNGIEPGASLLPVASSSAGDAIPSTPKRARKQKDTDASTPEKRGAKFKKRCPKNIQDRVDRVFAQRFFMIDRRPAGQLKEEYSVLGSTGNVYTVVIDRRPSCNCPDALKGNHCKHILFIFLKVLQVPQHSTYWYQKALLTAELAEVFREAPPPPNVVASVHIRDAYAKATGQSPGKSDADDSKPGRRIPGEEDDCPVCYESMYNVQESALAFCETCGNSLHKVCFQQWAKSAAKLTCVYCRATWSSSSHSAGVLSSEEGYVNLSTAAGVSPIRDTSSYHRGWRYGGRNAYS